jgi:hypothetical protein
VDPEYMKSTTPIAICVDPNGRGAWDVALPDEPRHLTCQTLEGARNLAHLNAASRHPCELIVHDAYHRVIQREIFDGGRDPSDK